MDVHTIRGEFCCDDMMIDFISDTKCSMTPCDSASEDVGTTLLGTYTVSPEGTQMVLTLVDDTYDEDKKKKKMLTYNFVSFIGSAIHLQLVAADGNKVTEAQEDGGVKKLIAMDVTAHPKMPHPDTDADVADMQLASEAAVALPEKHIMELDGKFCCEEFMLDFTVAKHKVVVTDCDMAGNVNSHLSGTYEIKLDPARLDITCGGCDLPYDVLSYMGAVLKLRSVASNGNEKIFNLVSVANADTKLHCGCHHHDKK